MSKFNWQSRWQETVGKTVTGLSDGAARCISSLTIGCLRGYMIACTSCTGIARLAEIVQQLDLVQQLPGVQVEAKLGRKARCKSRAGPASAQHQQQPQEHHKRKPGYPLPPPACEYTFLLHSPTRPRRAL